MVVEPGLPQAVSQLLLGCETMKWGLPPEYAPLTFLLGPGVCGGPLRTTLRMLQGIQRSSSGPMEGQGSWAAGQAPAPPGSSLPQPHTHVSWLFQSNCLGFVLLGQCFSNFPVNRITKGFCENAHSDSGGQGWGLRLCIQAGSQVST